MYTFEDIIGNSQLIENLQCSISNNRLSHAYIIDGAYGCGKKLLANTMAKTLLCENSNQNPCCSCKSCITFDSGNNPDIVYVKSSKSKSIGVDDIRQQIVNIVGIKPYRYDYKIFIVENADTMTVQAQNAILKTIEEPPPYAVFFMISTNFSSFLPTILSRCVLIKLKPIAENEVQNYILNNFDIDKSIAKVYSVFSQGSIGKAKSIVQSDVFLNTRNRIIQFMVDLKNRDIVEIFEMAKEFEVYKENIDDILDICILWYRDIIIFKTEKCLQYTVQSDKTELISVQASILNHESIFEIIEIIENTKYKLRLNANFLLAIEIMLLKIKENLNG